MMMMMVVVVVVVVVVGGGGVEWRNGRRAPALRAPSL